MLVAGGTFSLLWVVCVCVCVCVGGRGCWRRLVVGARFPLWWLGKFAFAEREREVRSSFAFTRLIPSRAQSGERLRFKMCNKTYTRSSFLPTIAEHKNSRTPPLSLHPKHMAVEQARLLKTGFLLKKGKVFWNKRYFTLYNDRLCYYMNERVVGVAVGV
jgi:hypothetical protein